MSAVVKVWSGLCSIAQNQYEYLHSIRTAPARFCVDWLIINTGWFLWMFPIETGPIGMSIEDSLINRGLALGYNTLGVLLWGGGIHRYLTEKWKLRSIPTRIRWYFTAFLIDQITQEPMWCSHLSDSCPLGW